jgi:hypothetical protein
MEPTKTTTPPGKVWRQIAEARRRQAAEAFWTDSESAEQQTEAVAYMAGRMKFRPKSVRLLPLEKKVRYLASMATLPDTIALRALVAYHIQQQRPMLRTFLDALEIPHEDGIITAEQVAAPGQEQLASAVKQINEQYAREDVTLYLSTLLWQDPDTWGGLGGLPELADTPDSPSGSAP